MTFAPAPWLGDHWLLSELAVAFSFACGWTSILIGALIGAGLSGVASGVKQGIDGKFDAGRLFKDIGIGFGTGGLTAGVGGLLGAGAGSATASAGESAASNVAGAATDSLAREAAQQAAQQSLAAVPAEAASSAAPGTFGATGIAVQNGAVAPLGAPGGLASAQSATDAVRQVQNTLPDALRAAQAPQAQELVRQGNVMANMANPPIQGPSFPQFQQATSIARGEVPQAVNWNSIADQALPRASVAKAAMRQAVGGAITGAARGFAEGNGDWRGPVYGALAGGLSSGIVPGASASLGPTLGRTGSQVVSRAIAGTAGGAIRGLADDDPGRGAIAGAASGALGSGVSSGLKAGWNAVTNDLMPLKSVDEWKGAPYARDTNPAADFNKMMANPYTPDTGPGTSLVPPRPGDAEWGKALGVSGMRAFGRGLIDQGVGMGTSAVSEAIRRPTAPPPILPTSGPNMYGATRSYAGIVAPWQRSVRRY